MHHLKFLKFLQKSLKSVIVIDDDVDTVEVFSEYLKIKGYNVLGIGHNGKAVELYEKNRPDVVVMDAIWPGGIRVTPKEEEIGLDLAQHGERAYVNE